MRILPILLTLAALGSGSVIAGVFDDKQPSVRGAFFGRIGETKLWYSVVTETQAATDSTRATYSLSIRKAPTPGDKIDLAEPAVPLMKIPAIHNDTLEFEAIEGELVIRLVKAKKEYARISLSALIDPK